MISTCLECMQGSCKDTVSLLDIFLPEFPISSLCDFHEDQLAYLSSDLRLSSSRAIDNQSGVGILS